MKQINPIFFCLAGDGKRVSSNGFLRNKTFPQVLLITIEEKCWLGGEYYFILILLVIMLIFYQLNADHS